MAKGSQRNDSITKTKTLSKASKAAVGDGATVTESGVDTVGAFPPDKIAGDPGSNPTQFKDSYRTQGRIIESFAQDQQEASIRIIKEADKTDIIGPYTKFILESVQEAHSERQQVVETFGDFYVFMYGERPPIYNFGGTLINTRNANWVSDFMLMYERYLRGTRCTEMKARALLTYGGRQVEGYIINVSSQMAASAQEGVSFSFQLLVTSRKLLGVSADMVSDIQSIGDPGLIELVDKLGAPGIKGSSDPATSDALVAGRNAIKGGTNPINLIA
jgi:hypothetical protein